MSDDQHTIPARDHRERSLAVPCPACGRFVETRLGAAPPDALRCDGCGASIPLRLRAQLDAAGRLDGCPACDYHTLCIQKDVNPRLGVLIVVVTFGALLLAGLSLPQLLVGLVLLALLDLALLRFVVRRLLICYRCKAQFRGFPPGPRCRPFDLSTWEAHDPPAGA